jgi:phosphate/sulfate permease
MPEAIITGHFTGVLSPRPHLDERPHIAGAIGFLMVLAAGLCYAAFRVYSDLSQAGEHNLAIGAFVLLGIALGFEFVNGFHDTVNAVATVTCTHSLPPLFAVIWSGSFNFLGVPTLSGLVAFTVVTLLPVELILQVGSGAGYAMIFALPPLIRVMLVLTRTGTPFFHGSKEGQKGMGLIMLILIGAAPTVYALNRAIPQSTTTTFIAAMQTAESVFRAHAQLVPPTVHAAAARATVGEAVEAL